MTIQTGDQATATLVIGAGPEDNRLTDVRVMLPGLVAQHVHHLCLDLRSCPHLTEAQLAELCRLRVSCQERQIDLDLLGLDRATEAQLQASATKTRRPRPSEPRRH